MNILKSHLYLVILLTIIGAVLHFYNLNWGAPFYFHPDERNIASSISQLSFPEQLNPHFFAYGSLPIYTLFLIGILGNFFVSCHHAFQHCTVTFEQAIILSRTVSALFATLLIPLIYIVGKRLGKPAVGVWAAAFLTFSTGMVQFAHFGTFEMWLTFFSFLLFAQALDVLKTPSLKQISLFGIIYGILVSVKVSSLGLLPLVLCVLLAALIHFHVRKVAVGLKFLGLTIVFLGISALVYVISNPYVLLDTTSFHSSMTYESSVALGTLPVFYTGAFFDTLPGIYQILHIYPFLINPLLTLIFLGVFIPFVFVSIKRKQQEYLLLTLFFLTLFLSQAVLFVKWIRYMVPTLPFIYLIVAIGYSELRKRFQHAIKLYILIPSLLLVTSVLFSLSYFQVVLASSDTRVTTAEWAENHILSSSPILSEVYDLGIMPFNSHFSNITLFNFYDLDNNSLESSAETLKQQLKDREYIILPSERVLQSRLQNPQKFPRASTFYANLFQGRLGYRLIYQTPCSLLCRLLYLNSPVSPWEQTAYVFDRPTVFIFKKQ